MDETASHPSQTDVALVEQHTRESQRVCRVGLGVVILLSGLHKLLVPAAWNEYLAPAFASRWPVSIDLTMRVFGLSELPVGILLICDRYTGEMAAIVSVSMIGTIFDLYIARCQTGKFSDILIRDIGILVLALGVAIKRFTANTTRT